MKGISIVVPVYNAEKYVEDCILSILDEMMEFDQLILVNDGSTDLSANICEKYLSANVILVSNSNHGVSFSRNEGIGLSKSEYIMFVDADDYLLQGWRNTIEQGMKNENDIVYFSQKKVEITNVKEIIDDILCFPNRKELSINASACWGKIFKVSFLQSNNLLFDCDLINGEDGLFCLQSILRTNLFEIIEKPNFYFYRTDNSTSATHTFNSKFLSSNFKFIKILKEELEKTDIFSIGEVNERVEFVTLQSLYLVMSKFSLIKNKDERHNYYSYINDFDDFFNCYHIKWKFGIIQNLVYILVKTKCFDISICVLNLIRYARNLVKR